MPRVYAYLAGCVVGPRLACSLHVSVARCACWVVALAVRARCTPLVWPTARCSGPFSARRASPASLVGIWARSPRSPGVVFASHPNPPCEMQIPHRVGGGVSREVHCGPRLHRCHPQNASAPRKRSPARCPVANRPVCRVNMRTSQVMLLALALCARGRSPLHVARAWFVGLCRACSLHVSCLADCSLQRPVLRTACGSPASLVGIWARSPRSPGVVLHLGVGFRSACRSLERPLRGHG